jgi:hypothetical protein
MLPSPSLAMLLTVDPRFRGGILPVSSFALAADRLSIFSVAASKSSLKKFLASNLSDDFEADPDNSVLMEDQYREKRDNSPMARRAAYLNQTTRGIDTRTPAQNLVETFEITKGN